MRIQFSVLREYRSTSNGFLIHLHMRGGGILSSIVIMSTRFDYPQPLRETRDGLTMFEVLTAMTVEIIVYWNVFDLPDNTA